MTVRTWISLPTLDLDASKAFYTALGAEFTPEMSDDNATMAAAHKPVVARG